MINCMVLFFNLSNQTGFKMNKNIFKRYSTLANFVALICGAVITTLPSTEISGQTVGCIMVGANVLIALCQAIKQEAAK